MWRPGSQDCPRSALATVAVPGLSGIPRLPRAEVLASWYSLRTGMGEIDLGGPPTDLTASTLQDRKSLRIDELTQLSRVTECYRFGWYAVERRVVSPTCTSTTLQTAFPALFQRSEFLGYVLERRNECENPGPGRPYEYFFVRTLPSTLRAATS